MEDVLEQTKCPMHFPFDRPDKALPAQYREAQAEDGLTKVQLWDGSEVWLASRYDDVRLIMSDDRFSASSKHASYPSVTPARGAVLKHDPETLLRLDRPEHTKYRRMLTSGFSHKRVEALMPQINVLVSGLLDKMVEKGPPTDLCESFCLPIPTSMIAMLTGVPYEDHELFESCARRKLDMTTTPENAVAAAAEQRAYLRQLLLEKNKDPEAHDDLLSRLLLHARAGEITFDEIVANAELLLVAGHETTANMTALGTLSLMQNPAVMEGVRNDQDGAYTRRTVEEMLRYFTIVQQTGIRIALEDAVVSGTLIRKGEAILAMIVGANHDPLKFPDPSSFDVSRPTMPAHVAFGFGIHQCLGQTLARSELFVAMRALAQRLPTIRLAVPVEELRFKGYSFVHGVESLPVVW